MNKQFIQHPESGKQSKLVHIQDGAVKTLGKSFDYDKIGAYASNSMLTQDYLAAFVSSHQSYQFEKEALDEYPDWQERIVILKLRTQAFMHSAINARVKPVSATGCALEREMSKRGFPRRFRKALVIHTQRSIELNSEFEGINIGYENVTIRFMSNGQVFNIYYAHSSDWRAVAPNQIILWGHSLSDLLHTCEHLATTSEIL